MMVAIENPDPGKPSSIPQHVAVSFVNRGIAIPTVKCGHTVVMIRMLGNTAARRLATEKGYDSVKRSFHREAPALPLIQPEKMIREEKSERDHSYTSAVRRTMRRDHAADEVRAIRGGVG